MIEHQIGGTVIGDRRRDRPTVLRLQKTVRRPGRQGHIAGDQIAVLAKLVLDQIVRALICRAVRCRLFGQLFGCLAQSDIGERSDIDPNTADIEAPQCATEDSATAAAKKPAPAARLIILFLLGLAGGFSGAFRGLLGQGEALQCPLRTVRIVVGADHQIEAEGVGLVFLSLLKPGRENIFAQFIDGRCDIDAALNVPKCAAQASHRDVNASRRVVKRARIHHRIVLRAREPVRIMVAQDRMRDLMS